MTTTDRGPGVCVLALTRGRSSVLQVARHGLVRHGVGLVMPDGLETVAGLQVGRVVLAHPDGLIPNTYLPPLHLPEAAIQVAADGSVAVAYPRGFRGPMGEIGAVISPTG